MNLTPYREALALPGVRSLMLVTLLARVPKTMTVIALTMYVVLELEHGYAAAGLAGAAMTIGVAVGAPLLGRLVDRRGLRPVLALTTVAEAAFWLTAPLMPYPVLLGGALLGGLLCLPVFGVARQSVAALVPAEKRRPAYALDSMAVELSFMVGPILAVLLATSVSPKATLLVVSGGVVLAGLALFWLNPPTRADHEPLDAARPVSRREWLTPRMLGLLAISAATTLVLGGTDVAVVAVLRAAEQVEWTGLVLAVWAAFSLVGAFVYGMVSRSVSPLLIVTMLGLCTIPVGFGGTQWWSLGLALLPAGMLCAPALASTANAVSQLVPASVRGEAMGLQNSAITVGLALGAPLAGAVIDASAPAWGFAATGTIGALIGLAFLAAELRHRRRKIAAPTTPAPTSVTAAPADR
ncbi:MFS transporter [Plantactinospora soyae]|uniref:MFS family permease n=1 Tax=Plantactinospora soyae TaxID=1544732 RepID=A0A927QWY3_9ACTN|nr:MFS transporter [Plantactinospora soyae]MBE1487440.1 MFS family permease [Plantactinospora soyae]